MATWQIHAFSDHVHRGNAAGVCLVNDWPDDDTMALVARDYGPSVTGFIKLGPKKHFLRLFTRGMKEVKSFCGHATFAAAHVVLSELHDPNLIFETACGERQFETADQRLMMSIPKWPSQQIRVPVTLAAAIGTAESVAYRSERDLVVVLKSPEAVAALTPDFEVMRSFGDTAIIATAASGRDVVFRFFCPGFSIGENEDPATGSAISSLAPFWEQRLGRRSLEFRQISSRGATFEAIVEDDSVRLISRCVTFVRGEIDSTVHPTSSTAS